MRFLSLSRNPKPATNKPRSGIERLKQQAIVRVGVHLPQNGLDFPFGGNDEGGALSPKLVAFPAFRFFHPHTVCPHDAFLSIADQREWQRIKFDKRSMTLKRIRADTEKTGPVSELCPCVAKLARLGGASRRMVLRIEIENNLKNPFFTRNTL